MSIYIDNMNIFIIYLEFLLLVKLTINPHIWEISSSISPQNFLRRKTEEQFNSQLLRYLINILNRYKSINASEDK